MSGIVLNTDALVWYLLEPSRLSQKALMTIETVEQSGEPLYVPTISLVEITYLVEKGRLPAAIISRLLHDLEDNDSMLLPLSLDVSIAQILSQIPREQVPDMPDRIIGATAKFVDKPLVTCDSKLQASELHTIW